MPDSIDEMKYPELLEKKTIVNVDKIVQHYTNVIEKHALEFYEDESKHWEKYRADRKRTERVYNLLAGIFYVSLIIYFGLQICILVQKNIL